jgi:hypothetical protein
MDQSVHIVHLNSDSSLSVHSHNRPDDFTVKLSETLSLDPLGDWYCSLKQCYLGFNFSYPVYACCSLVSESFAGDRRLSTLRVLHGKKVIVFDDSVYIPVRVRDVEEVRLYFLRTIDYEPPKYSRTREERAAGPFGTHCTLEFRRIALTRG